MTDANHLARVDVICRRANGVQPLRQVSAIPDGFMKNRSQIWRLSVDRAYLFRFCDLIDFNHRAMTGTFGAGSKRTKSKVWATDTGRAYVELCREAARQSNLSWPDHPYDGYVTWQDEWLERRARFKECLLALAPAQ